MITPAHFSEAWRIFKRSRAVKRKGIRKYEGSAEQICRQAVSDCWNGRYFQVSNGHFCEFYMRDLGWCVESLLKLGHDKEVLKTLEYALEKYSKQKLTTTITPEGKCIDVFAYGADTLPFLIRSLRVSGAKELIEKYRDFLEKEARRYFYLCFDTKTSMIRVDRNFSSMKDESLRKSSAYDNCMAAMLSKELDNAGLKNPFNPFDIKKQIKKTLWNGKYFYDDLEKHEIVTGDANVFPFWTGVFDDKEMMKSCFKEIQKAGLDGPFPLKYSSKKHKEHKLNIVSSLVDGYEQDAIWAHMGMLYLELLKKIDKQEFKKQLSAYKNIIEKHKNFLEVYDKDGKPFKSFFYFSDEGMLWAANHITLIRSR